MTKKNDLDLVPRVSILEKGQQDLQRDLQSLSHSVKEQGNQLTAAIMSLSAAQNANYNALAEKIGATKQTDWQSLLSGLGLVILVVGGLMTHVYTQFTFVDKQQNRIQEEIKTLQELSIENLKAVTNHTAKLDTKREH